MKEYSGERLVVKEWAWLAVTGLYTACHTVVHCVCHLRNAHFQAEAPRVQCASSPPCPMR